MHKRLLDVLFGISVICFLIFSIVYFLECKKIDKSISDIDKVQNRIDKLINQPIRYKSRSNKKGVVKVLPKYQSLYRTNSDMIGYLYIDKMHSFPILQKIDNQNYYLSHNFFKEYDSNGSIFANSKCSLGNEGITLIYGHHIKRNRLFSCLDSFKKESYFKQVKDIRIDTLYKKNIYKVVAVAICNMNDSFKYYDYVGKLSKKTFEYWKKSISKKLIEGSIQNLSYKDTIVELSTCSYERKDNRVVLILSKK